MKDDPLRAEIAEKFKLALQSRRISKTQAAKELKVSRQMLYEYLKGKSLPGHEVLQRACSAWELQLNYKDFLVTARSFPDTRHNTTVPEQLVLDLQEAIDRLCDDDISVRILKKDNGRIELHLDVRFGSAG